MNSSLIISHKKKDKKDFYLISKKKRLVVSDKLTKYPLLKSNKNGKYQNQKVYKINRHHTNYKNGLIIKKTTEKKRNKSIEIDNKNKNHNYLTIDNLKHKSDKNKINNKGKIIKIDKNNKISNQEYFPIYHYLTRRFDNDKNIHSVKRRLNKAKINNSCLNNKSLEPKINRTNLKNVKNAILKTVINPENKKVTQKGEKIEKSKTIKISNATSLRKNKFKDLKDKTKTNDNFNTKKNSLFLFKKPIASSCDKRNIETNSKENTINTNYNISNFNQETTYISKNEAYSLNTSDIQKNYSLTQSSRISNSRKQKYKRFNFRHLIYKTELNLNNEKNKELSKNKCNSSCKRQERNASKQNKNQTSNLSPINVHRKITFKKNEIIDITNKNNRVIITKKYISPNKKKDILVSLNENNIENYPKKMLEDKPEYFDFIPKNLIMICDKMEQMNIIIKPRKNLELKLFKHIKRNSVL